MAQIRDLERGISVPLEEQSLNTVHSSLENMGIGRRGFLKGLAAGVGAALAPNIAFGREKRIHIPEKARDTIWAGFPEMQNAIDLHNEGKLPGVLSYVIHPNTPKPDYRNTTSGSNTPNRANLRITSKKIPVEQMTTPQYLLLNRLVDSQYTSNFLGSNFAYRGVPVPEEGSGEWFFGKALLPKNSDTRDDILSAMYIGATGSRDGAIPIINGSLFDSANESSFSNVYEMVRKWDSQEKFSYLDDEGKLELAYLSSTLKEVDFRDKNLVALSLLVMTNYLQDQGEINKPRGEIYAAILPNSFEGSKIPIFRSETNKGKYYPIRIASI